MAHSTEKDSLDKILASTVKEMGYKAIKPEQKEAILSTYQKKKRMYLLFCPPVLAKVSVLESSPRSSASFEGKMDVSPW